MTTHPRSPTSSDTKARERAERTRQAEEITAVCSTLTLSPAQALNVQTLGKPFSNVRAQLSFVDTHSGEASLQALAVGRRVSTLVFASAKNPGGGWRRGSKAQEEDVSLASSWGVQAERSRGFFDPAADWMGPNQALVAQGVWLRGLHGESLNNPLPAHFVGVSAPNVSWATNTNQKVVPRVIQQALAERLALALEWSEQEGCDTFIGGLIGCGVFGWTIEDCAQSWAQTLARARRIPNHIVFAGMGRPEVRRTFEHILQPE